MSPTNVYSSLTDEWTLLACTESARRALSTWARTEPDLRSFADPAQVVAACHHRGDSAAANQILAAVLRVADCDPLAERLVLQALLPALAACSRRASRRGWIGGGAALWAGTDELDQDLLALAVERVRAAAGQHLEWPASTLAGQVWRRIRMAVDRHRAQTRRTVPLDPDPAGDAWADPGGCWESRLARLLCDAVRDGTVAHRDGAVIYSTRVLGVPPAAAAYQLELDVRALWQRRRRAERALAASLAA